MLACRLIVDPPSDGAWNMAVDEALLEDAAGGGMASLRFYQWREPTLSLGYFQSYAERHDHPASRHAAVVRRLSGGGALIHDRELTYSLCLPPSHPHAREAASLYGLVHDALLEALATWNIAAAPYGAAPAVEGEEPFLCFARRTSDDLVFAGSRGDVAAKILGSAQRRRRGAVLQHGGLLLAASDMAPELPGLRELSGATLPVEALCDRWSSLLADRLKLRLIPGELSGELRETAQRLQAEKFGHRSWTERR